MNTQTATLHHLEGFRTQYALRRSNTCQSHEYTLDGIVIRIFEEAHSKAAVGRQLAQYTCELCTVREQPLDPCKPLVPRVGGHISIG